MRRRRPPDESEEPVRYAAVCLLAAATSVVAAGPAPTAGAPRGGVAARGWNEPVLVSRTHASVETSLAINPRDERELLACSPSGVPAVYDRQSHFFRSTDGGRAWSYVHVEQAFTDTRRYAFEGGDCDVAYDAGGTAWVADTWAGNLSVGHSADGEHWTGTALATSAPVVDRPWLVGGPPGTLYLSYQDAQCCTPSVVWFTKTTDYGATFSPAVPVTTASPDGAFTWQGNVVVANGGRDLYLVYSRRDAPLGGVDVPYTISLADSHDGGATWRSRDIATLPGRTASLYPSLARDAGGWLHVVWAATREDDEPVFYTLSKDGGGTWSRPRALNAGRTGTAPWVAAGAKGRARVVWLGSPEAGGFGGWYFYYAKVDNGRTVATGRTTTRPLWTGDRPYPEFETVRLDRHGRMHLGMSVFTEAPGSPNGAWAVYYQREAASR
jgi:hypothetical protein